MLKSCLITIGKLYHFFTGKTLKENYMYQKQWTWTSLNTLYNYVLLIITTVIKNVCLSITSLISCKILYDLKCKMNYYATKRHYFLLDTFHPMTYVYLIYSEINA